MDSRQSHDHQITFLIEKVHFETPIQQYFRLMYHELQTITHVIPMSSQESPDTMLEQKICNSTSNSHKTIRSYAQSWASTIPTAQENTNRK